MSGTAPAERPAIRPARPADVAAICSLLKAYADMGNLLPRTAADIEHNLDWFEVIDTGQGVAACGALEVFTDELGEIRSLVVSPDHQRRGLGRLMVEQLMERARRLGLGRVMALTYVPEFFHGLGFVTVPKDSLPEKVWGICVNCYRFHNCDEIAVLKKLA
jgi:amino-acid N-acetyltransferase